MTFAAPWQIIVVALAGWMSREQQKVLDYLIAENEILEEQVGGRRFRFSDRQRRKLATLAKSLGRRELRKLSTIVTPDTLLRWYRQLIANKYDGSAKRGVTVSAYVAHYHGERNHQGLGNRLLNGQQRAANDEGSIQCRRRLGGLLR